MAEHVTVKTTWFDWRVDAISGMPRTQQAIFPHKLPTKTTCKSKRATYKERAAIELNTSNAIMPTDGDCGVGGFECMDGGGKAAVDVQQLDGDPRGPTKEGPKGESWEPLPRSSSRKTSNLRELARSWFLGRRVAGRSSPEEPRRWETFTLCPSSECSINFAFHDDPPLERSEEDTNSETKSLRSEDTAVVDGVMVSPHLDTQHHNAVGCSAGDHWPEARRHPISLEVVACHASGEINQQAEEVSSERGGMGLCGLCSLRKRKTKVPKLLTLQEEPCSTNELADDAPIPEPIEQTTDVRTDGVHEVPTDEAVVNWPSSTLPQAVVVTPENSFIPAVAATVREVSRSYSDIDEPLKSNQWGTSYSSGIESDQLCRCLRRLETKEECKTENADCWSVVDEKAHTGEPEATLPNQAKCCHAAADLDVCFLQNEVLRSFSQLGDEPYPRSRSRETYVIAKFDYPADSNNNAAVETNSQEAHALPGMPSKTPSFLSLIKEARSAGMVPASLPEPSYSWEKAEAKDDDCMTLPNRRLKQPEGNTNQTDDKEEMQQSIPVETNQQNQNSTENKTAPSLQNVIETMQKLAATEQQVKAKKEAERVKKAAEEANVAKTAAEVMKKAGAPVDYKERKRLRQQKEMEEARKELLEATTTALKDRLAFAKKDEKNDSTEVSNKLFCGSTQAMFDPYAPLGEPQASTPMPPAPPSYSPLHPPNAKLEGDIGKVPSPLPVIEEPKKEVMPSLPSVDTISDMRTLGDAGCIEVKDVTDLTPRNKRKPAKPTKSKSHAKHKKRTARQYKVMPTENMGLMPMGMPNMMIPQPMGIPVPFGVPQCTPLAMSIGYAPTAMTMPQQMPYLQAPSSWGPLIPQMMMSNHGRATEDGDRKSRGRKCKEKPKRKKGSKSEEQKTNTSTRKRDFSFSSFSDTSSFSSGSSSDTSSMSSSSSSSSTTSTGGSDGESCSSSCSGRSSSCSSYGSETASDTSTCSRSESSSYGSCENEEEDSCPSSDGGSTSCSED